MKVVIAPSLSAEKVERTLVISGSQDSVDRIAAFLGMLQFNGAIGHSGMFALVETIENKILSYIAFSANLCTTVSSSLAKPSDT